MAGIPTSRKEALLVGASTYFNGKPCKNGHIAERLTEKSHCVECKRASARKYVVTKYHTDPVFAEKSRQQFKRYLDDKRKNDPEYLAEDRRKSRIRQAVRRKETDYAYDRAYEKRTIEKKRARSRNRKAAIENAPGTHTAEDIKDIKLMQRSKCAYCRVYLGVNFHVDHIMPIALGGANDRKNLQCLCPTCNMSKGAKHPLDFARWLGLLM